MASFPPKSIQILPIQLYCSDLPSLVNMLVRVTKSRQSEVTYSNYHAKASEKQDS